MKKKGQLLKMNMMAVATGSGTRSNPPVQRHAEPKIRVEADYAEAQTIETLAARRREFRAQNRKVWADVNLPSDL